MKRYIKSRHNLPIVFDIGIQCGVTVNPKLRSISFDWKHDTPDDIITLQSDCSGEYTDDGVTYIYGYSYTKNAKAFQINYFRDYIKGKNNDSVWTNPDVEEFVNKGVLNIERYMNFDDIGAIVNLRPAKRPSIMDIIRGYVREYVGKSTYNFELVKKAYNDVEFDSEKAYLALKEAGWNEDDINQEITFTINKFNQLKKTKELFEIKRFIPKEIRAGFLNYFKFATPLERTIFITLQGINILIYDDFITSGSTIKEVIRYLRAINPNNTLTVFVLVKQHR